MGTSLHIFQSWGRHHAALHCVYIVCWSFRRSYQTSLWHPHLPCHASLSLSRVSCCPCVPCCPCSTPCPCLPCSSCVPCRPCSPPRSCCPCLPSAQVQLLCCGCRGDC